MKLKAIALDEELIRLTAPPYILELSRNEELLGIFLGAFEEEELIGYAYFTHVPGQGEDFYFEYIYLTPSRRNKGLSKVLFSLCANYLENLGGAFILARQCIQPVYAEEFNAYLQGLGFYPLNLTEELEPVLGIEPEEDFLLLEYMQPLRKGLS